MDRDDRFGSDTYEIIGACIEVHRLLGPGLLESAYEECLAHELELRGIPFARQVRCRFATSRSRSTGPIRPTSSCGSG